MNGHSANIVGLAVVLLPVVLWKRPQLAPIVFLASALLIEQFAQPVVSTDTSTSVADSTPLIAPITPRIPLFHGIGSLHIQPADLLLLFVLITYLVRSIEWGARWWPRSHVRSALVALLGVVALGVVVGLAHHGSLRVALMETRPYVYLGSTYVLTAVLVRSRQALEAALWALVVGTGIKAIQGLYVFVKVHNMHPRPSAVLGHEEAYFFAVFVFLVLALWLFEVPGRLRTTATWLLPLVVAADLANNRRAAWLVLGGGLVALAVVGYRSLPSRRRVLRAAVVVSLIASAIYFPAYWHKTGSLAQPARALRSQISPDARDASSDLYRVQEDANLQLNIRKGGLIGNGFGVPIDYVLPIVNIKKGDPLIAYVPHNGVLYVLMRMGLLGGIAVWALLGAGIIAGCRLARSVDRQFAVVGAVVVCSLVAYALEGATDQGFFFYRIAFVTGSLLGLVEAGRRLARTDARVVFNRLRLSPSKALIP
jgi:hypothetical protein